ncbi:kinetochore protein SPC25 homolog isoform X2 [Macadamia integrifolia]|uniref:kinetochore protein SPC25 homolog isoform X2 n=1 Tax=Macadamia integrifolia TaxID=60698 RepID=UPI001C4F8ACC|nr:kinetochore protein SPC25 homolog isoform X2 [Macadamia integrifolia]
MERRTEASIQRKMEELRLVCDREIAVQNQRVSSAADSFRKSRESVKLKAEETAENQVKLGKLKAHLRELEDVLFKALAVKNRKEAKRMSIVDSIAAAKTRIKELRENLQDQRAKKDEYAGTISRQSLDLGAPLGKGDQEMRNRDVEETISWYNRALGFRIEGGHGVKFIFNQINLKNPNEEYSFTVRHANDIYTLLDCNPYLDDIKELIQELNQTNGLFNFVSIMREKFQAAASIGIVPQATSYPDSTTISRSAPAASVSVDSTSDSSENENGLQSQSGETRRPPRKVNHGRMSKSKVLSSTSAASIRRSPRFKVKK